jgi:hypothetical protein
MKPKFADSHSWRQAELLMQPAFIRLLDNLRKEGERSPWKASFRDIPMWSDDVSPETQTRFSLLKQQLETAEPTQAEVIQQALEKLPQPFPGYQLCLQYQDQQVVIDLWELCYQVCFCNYSPPFDRALNQVAEIDTTLIDATGDVDWQRLDDKTKLLVQQLFANLPSDRTS